MNSLSNSGRKRENELDICKNQKFIIDLIFNDPSTPEYNLIVTAHFESINHIKNSKMSQVAKII